MPTRVLLCLAPTSGIMARSASEVAYSEREIEKGGESTLRLRRLKIQSFRGISRGCIDFTGHTLLVGGNNVGKSTVCEALDLLLGPERLARRPVVDEHDFHLGCYLNEEGAPIEIRIEAILIELSDEAQRRFISHLRRWNDKTGTFIDEQKDGIRQSDVPAAIWALPLLFVGRYDPEEDDFMGNTFFDHPAPDIDLLDEETGLSLGKGRKPFTRVHKRLCGFVFLRSLRTGSRALSLQRGSLLDTVLKLSGIGAAEMWRDSLARLQDLDPAIGDIEQLKHIQTVVRSRLAHFVNLAPDDKSTAFFASELTREHLREVLRLFVAAMPDQHLLPFRKLGTGSINLLVFALLTFVAELKDKQSVIFAMEEPEIALPPHTQRRVMLFVMSEMGQSIVTSHSPYVIEQFDHGQIVILNRDGAGTLTGQPIDQSAIPRKTFRTERRQFAEAILSRAVLVVEGATEASLFPVASSILEESFPGAYMHLDLAGVSMFNAGSEGSVPRYGPVFTALGKMAFAFHDKPNRALGTEAIGQLNQYKEVWESPNKGIETLLVEEMPISVVRRFLIEVNTRADYPQMSKYDPAAADREVAKLATEVLKARKGDAHGYAAILMEQCQDADELPETIRMILETIHALVAATNESNSEVSQGNLGEKPA